jgi:hypothetical protein
MFLLMKKKKYINSIIVNFPIVNKLPGHYLKASYLHSKLIFEEIKIAYLLMILYIQKVLQVGI